VGDTVLSDAWISSSAPAKKAMTAEAMEAKRAVFVKRPRQPKPRALLLPLNTSKN
jgi:hypothetical protein